MKSRQEDRATTPPRSAIVSSIGFVPAGERDLRTGLVGYVTFVVNDVLLLDGITLRMTQERRPTLSFPARTDRRGNRHAIIRPIDDKARRAIEAEVFAALGVDPEAGL